MSERYDIQPGSTDLRLVVQRKVRNDHSAVRAERTTVQIYPANYAQVSRGLYRPGSRSIPGAQVQGDGSKDEREEVEEAARGERQTEGEEQVAKNE